METSKLRTIQHPDRTASLLEEYVRANHPVPGDSWRVNSASELTVPLRRLISSQSSSAPVWCAWANTHDIWFFSAVPSLELARERKQPVLHVQLHDAQGRLVEVVCCVLTRDGKWQKCTP
jgi:hypothetical protein